LTVKLPPETGAASEFGATEKVQVESRLEGADFDAAGVAPSCAKDPKVMSRSANAGLETVLMGLHVLNSGQINTLG
jgi:hypothetical protein